MKIKRITNNENAIIVSNYQVMSTGVNIPSLKWLIFGSPTKSSVKVLQSIGRILRLHKSKSIVTLYDIVDDMSVKLRVNTHLNFAARHFQERLTIYQEQKFDVEMKKIPLFDE